MQKLPHQTRSFSEFTLDLTRGCLQRAQEEIKLRPKSFEVLKYLVENNGRLISKDELIHAVWVETAVTDDSLVQCMKDIRHALRDEAQQIIKTVPRRGYIFDKEVSENGSAAQMTTYTDETAGVQIIIEEETDEHEANEVSAQTPALLAAPKVSPVSRITNAIKRHKIATAVASVALAALVIAGVVFAKPILTWWYKPPSIAILPFVNATGDPGLDSAGDGLTEAVIEALYGIKPPRESYQEANEWWAKALQRDDSLQDVRVQMLVQKLWLDWDWEGIEKLSKRTGVYGDYLAAMGRLDESLAGSKQRLAWLPTAPLWNHGVGFNLYLMHRHVEAVEQFKKAISLDPENWPAHFALGFTYSQKGMHEKAVAEMNRAVELQENAPPSLAGLGYVYAVAGRRDEALKILNQLQERADRGEYVTPFGIAWVQIGLGDKDQAFAWLDKAYNDRSSGMIYLKVNPIFDPVRSDPRFTSLLQRMKLPT